MISNAKRTFAGDAISVPNASPLNTMSDHINNAPNSAVTDRATILVQSINALASFPVFVALVMGVVAGFTAGLTLGLCLPRY